MADISRDQALTSMRGFLTSGAFSDLTIVCGMDSYKVHKVIVCGRADFLARAERFGGKESQSGTIELPEDEPAVVKLLVQYLYEGEYEPLLPANDRAGTMHAAIAKPRRPTVDDKGNVYNYGFPHYCGLLGRKCHAPNLCPHHTCKMEYLNGYGCNFRCQAFICAECNNPPQPPPPSLNGTSDQLLTHAKMYEIADKYDIVGLKDLVKEKFSRSCKHFWNDEEFAVAAHYAYSTTPDEDKGLRDIVSTTISSHMEIIEKAEIRVLMTEFNGLALGVLDGVIAEHGLGQKN
ncbi:hypothetical protein T440DRAFT_511103 [Plenodomus tracheiphilus IPT5]|uniref:BTB domain-containing protein n=1 Tax=Plenodomus tracheiphilus IPT5 TaxID=1408161 RepID=A0A6A7ATK3_9PLEO|nr:hypothetical protein T440DRAFT_511103 [Plenodomus tracheiphilus IPT5]